MKLRPFIRERCVSGINDQGAAPVSFSYSLKIPAKQILELLEEEVLCCEDNVLHPDRTLDQRYSPLILLKAISELWAAPCLFSFLDSAHTLILAFAGSEPETGPERET